MNIDVAFGQYFEGNSVIHRLDPRFKLVITILFIVVIFLAENVFSFLLLTAALIGLILLHAHTVQSHTPRHEIAAVHHSFYRACERVLV